ncbi:MAG TPA: LamG domain-containing protein, partial [Candidatus Tectomicrobia bacterium]
MAARGSNALHGMARATQKLRSTAFTMMGWFYNTSLATRGHLVTYEGAAGVQRRLRVETNGSFNLWAGVDSVNGSEVATGRWFHACMVHDGATTRAYLDGVLDISIANTAGPSGNLWIGNELEIQGAQWLNGRWAAIKLWDGALTGDEIRREMAQYLPVRLADLNTFSPCLTAQDAPKTFVQDGRLLPVSRHEVARHPGDPNNRWIIHGFPSAEGSLVGSLTTEDDPPIVWGGRRVRRAPRRASDVTLTVTPAKTQWGAQTPTATQPVIASVIMMRGRPTTSPRWRVPPTPLAERQHPLNQGLLAWYLAQPWMFPGDRFYDDAGGHAATLLNMAAGSEASGWGAPTRPRARGELRFDGVDDAVALPAVSVGSALFTVALWM